MGQIISKFENGEQKTLSDFNALGMNVQCAFPENICLI